MKMLGDFFVAAAFEEQVKRATQGHFDTRDLLIGLTIALAVGAGIVLWIYFRSRMKSDDQDRERLSQMTRGHSGGKKKDEGEKKSTTTVTKDGLHRRRKRRRRRDHRQRNPSLSETGGLPPPRSDDQLPKY